MNLILTKENHVICEECGNADSTTKLFASSTKLDDRLSKDNLKFYKVKWVYGGKNEFNYQTINLKVGDVIMTEALGIDIEFEGKKYKVFDTTHIISTIKEI